MGTIPSTSCCRKIVAGAWGPSSGQKLSLPLHFSPDLGLALESFDDIGSMRTQVSSEKKAEKPKYIF